MWEERMIMLLHFMCVFDENQCNNVGNKMAHKIHLLVNLEYCLQISFKILCEKEKY